jgi:multiple sugar transport system substrate-binding protein
MKKLGARGDSVKYVRSILILAILFVLSSCNFGGEGTSNSKSDSGQASNQKASPDNSQPVTLKILQHIGAITDEEFNAFIAEPVRKKFPHITMEIVREGKAGTGKSMDELLSANEFPDLVWTGSNSIYDLYPKKLLYDLNPLIKQNGFDLHQFNQAAINELKAFGSNGELYALPFSINYSALFYNKDLFDRFGVNYPKDGMNWDEYVALAKQMSRTDGGTKYYGTALREAQFLSSPLSLPYVNLKTETSALNTEGWQKFLNRMKQLADAIDTDGKPYTAVGGGLFENQQTAAMILFNIDYIAKLNTLESKGSKLNWDLASYPSFPEAPGKSSRSVTHNLLIASTSKHKNEAFQAMAYVTTDKEVQTASSRSGRVSALNDPEIRKSFAGGLQQVQTKNLAAIFKTTPAPNPAPSLYSNSAAVPLNAALNNVLTGKMDVVTALRKADEDFNILIEEMKRDGLVQTK